MYMYISVNMNRYFHINIYMNINKNHLKLDTA